MTRQALVVRHVAYEGAAGYRAPIEAAGYALRWLAADAAAAFEGDALLAPDLVVLMGGPMGVYETGAYAWIAPEVAAVARRLAAGRPTLGICLGSQIIAAALGASVYPGPRREVGFGPLTLTEAGLASPLRTLAGVPVLHWHGDTFDLPAGATLLASTATYRHQAFAVGTTALALQFHAEMGEDPRFATWLDEGADYVAGAGVAAAELAQAHDRLGPGAVAAGQRMIADWLTGLDAA